jgi:hypothetical protein
MPTQVFRPENRLAHMVRDGGPGADMRQLIASAEAQVEELRASTTAYVQGRLDHILLLAREDDQALLARAHELGAAALGIAEVAGAAQLGALGEAAAGVSAMIEAFRTGGVWRPDALRVHLDALQLLASDGAHAPGHEEMLARLRGLRAAIGVEE